METEYISQQAKPLQRVVFKLPTDTRSEREKFVDEAFDKINTSRKGTKYKQLTERSISIMVNSMCPAKCPDAFIIDVRKSCQVAKKLLRNYIGIELNPEYIKIAEHRLSQESLFMPIIEKMAQ